MGWVSSNQCHNNPILVPYRKTHDPVNDLYDGHTYDLKIRVDIWTSMYVVPVEYRKFDQTFHLTMWFFHFITGNTFKWDYVFGRNIFLMVWIGLCTKLIFYRDPPEPFRWSFRGFGFIWRLFMLNWMLWTKNDFNVSHRNQVNAPSNMKLVTSLMNFECQPYGILKVLSYHKESEVVDPIIFAATVGLGDRIKKLVSYNFMCVVISVSVIFDTGDIYSCSSNKGDFVKLE